MKNPGIGPLINFFNRQGKDETYRSIAGTLLTNSSRLGHMSIYEAADLCYTSPATITRVAKKAGYEGYNDLKEAVGTYCSGYFRENRILSPEKLTETTATEAYLSVVINMLQEMSQTLEQAVIERAVSLIHDADSIYYFGTCDTGRRFQQDLFVTGKYMEIFQNFSADSPRPIEWGPNSLAIIENPGYPWFENNEMIRQIQEAGAKVLQITGTPISETQADLDLTIQFHGTKSGRDEVFFQAIMSILSLEYRKRYMDAWFYNQ